MPRTLSKTAREAKNQEIRDQFPELESRLDAFRENAFTPQDVMAIIRYERAGGELEGELSEKYAGLEDAEKTRVRDSANALIEGYSEFFDARQQHGASLPAANPFDALEAEIGKVCNYSNATPYHKARQGIENHLAGREQELDSPDNVAGLGEDKPKERPEPERNQADRMRGDAQKLGMVAGTAAGIGAAAEAAKSWRERAKKPEAKKKALAFAGAAVVTLGAVAAAVVMQRGGLGALAGQLGGGKGR